MTYDTANDPVARIGDRIKFKVGTREGMEGGIRKVVGRRGDGYEVVFRGYRSFIVHRHEVFAIYRDAEILTRWDDEGAWVTERKAVAP